MFYIIIGTTGSGKTTFAHHFFNQLGFQHFKKAVTHTTRHPRPSEVEGEDYYFTDPNTFKQLHLLESTHYAGEDYGLTTESLQASLPDGYAILDASGLEAVRKYLGDIPHQVIYLHLTQNQIKDRLELRGDHPDQIIERLFQASIDEENNYPLLDDPSVITLDAGLPVEEIIQAANEAIASTQVYDIYMEAPRQCVGQIRAKSVAEAMSLLNEKYDEFLLNIQPSNIDIQSERTTQHD